MSAHTLLNARPSPTMVNGRLMLPLSYVEALEEQLRESMRARSEHRGFMATVGEMWKSLPENLSHKGFAQSPDTLRKHALIRTGWCDIQTIVFDDVLSAMRAAPRISYMARMGQGKQDSKHAYVIVTVEGPVVVCAMPMSQSYKEMGREDFKQSKADVLDYIRGMIGVSKEDLERAMK